MVQVEKEKQQSITHPRSVKYENINWVVHYYKERKIYIRFLFNTW